MGQPLVRLSISMEQQLKIQVETQMPQLVLLLAGCVLIVMELLLRVGVRSLDRELVCEGLEDHACLM